MKKPKRNLISTIRNLQINKLNTKTKSGQTCKSNYACKCPKSKDHFRFNTNLIEVPKIVRYQLDQQNKQNQHLTNRVYPSSFNKIETQKLIRSKSHTKLHGEKYQGIDKHLIKPMDRFKISQVSENQQIKFQQNIINYIKSIEKNVNDLKQCVFHNSVPNRHLSNAKRTTESSRALLMKRSYKSVVNLQTVHLSNRLNVISSKNIKNKRKVINPSSNNANKKQLVSNSLCDKMSSIKRIRDLYKQKYGDQTTNIVDLYNFYLSLQGRQLQTQQNKDYRSSHAQNYLLENNSEEYNSKQEHESTKGYNPCFVLDIDSIELEEDYHHQINSITTQFSKTKKSNIGVAQIKELVYSQNVSRAIDKKESIPFKDQIGILNQSHNSKSQNALIRLETRDLFIFDPIQRAEQQAVTTIKSPNVLPVQTQQRGISIPDKRLVKELKQPNNQILTHDNTKQKLKVRNYKGDEVDQYIEECIKMNDRVFQQKTLVCTIPPIKGVLFTSFDLQEIDSTPDNPKNSMHQYQGERDEEQSEEDQECHTLSAENQIQKPKYQREAMNEAEYRQTCSEPNNQVRERQRLSRYGGDNSV